MKKKFHNRLQADGEKVKSLFGEFKKFIARGNVLDMAVGVIVGSAFTAIVTALSNGILKPLINWVLALVGGDSNALESAYTILKATYTVNDAGEKVLDLANSIYIDWGAFISSVINFLLIAFVVFTIVKVINHASEKLNVNAIMKESMEKKLAKGEELTKSEKRWVKRMKAYRPEFVPAQLQPKAEVKEPEPPVPTETEKLLAEILAELKKENK